MTRTLVDKPDSGQPGDEHAAGVDAGRREALRAGRDDTGIILNRQHEDDVRAQRRGAALPRPVVRLDVV